MKTLSYRSFIRLALGLLLSAGLSAQASTITVLNLNDTGAGSLRQAISNSLSGDTIVFNNGLTGTITLTNGQIQITNALNILGPGPTKIGVSGNNSNRVFYINYGSTVTISGLSINHGLSMGENGFNTSYYCSNGFPVHVPATVGGDGIGGGIQNWGSLTISNCILNDNIARGGDGGNGFYVHTVCLAQGDFGGYGTNAGGSLGGAIFSSGYLSTINCTFSNNSAVGGQGGLGVDGSYNEYDDSGGDGGFAQGGAVFLFGFWRATNCTFVSNSALAGTGGGGGIYIAATAEHHGIGGYGGRADGGVIYAAAGLGANPTDFSLANCTLCQNIAHGGNGGQGGLHGGSGGPGNDARGGAIFNLNINDYSGIFSCTIVNNGVVRGIGGSGTYNDSSQTYGASGYNGDIFGGGIVPGGAHIQNTIIAGNSCPAFNVSDGIDVFTYPYAAVSYGLNLIGITNGSVGWLSSDIFGISDLPLDPKLGPLQDNGGLTYTMALLTNSPAIDKGINNAGSKDQRGAPRPLDLPTVSNAVGGDGSDIGAYETTLTLDIGLRVFDGVTTNKIAGEYPAVSPLRISKNGTNYGILLTATNAANASKFRVQTSSGIKAWQTLP